MHPQSSALTHPGRRRESNEDSVLSRPGIGLWVVCDGMGGHAAGEVASRVAVDEIEAFIDRTDGNASTDQTWPFGYMPDLGLDGTRLVSAFRLANRAIDQRVADDPSLHGMATTAVALLLATKDRHSWRPADLSRAESRDLSRAESRDLSRAESEAALAREGPAPPSVTAYVAHVGDSRAYLWRGNTLTRLTADHSWVEEQIAAGTLTEDDARTHPWRNLVTRAVSGAPNLDVAVSTVELETGDRVLLCSDGLTSPLTDATIANLLAQASLGETGQACESLIDAANAAGGPDNITVVVVDLGDAVKSSQ